MATAAEVNTLDRPLASTADLIVKATRDAGNIMGMGAAEAGRLFYSAGTAVGDGVKATGSLVTDFEKSVAAGFQVVFGEDIDKSDAGLEVAFAKVDADKSGEIDVAEMKAYILSVYGTGLNDSVVCEMMATADVNKNGKINLDEFKTIMHAGPQNVKAIGDSAALLSMQSVEGIKAVVVATVESAKAVGIATADSVLAVGTATVDGAAYAGQMSFESANAVGKKGLEGAMAVGDGVKATGTLMVTEFEKTLASLSVAAGVKKFDTAEMTAVVESDAALASTLAAPLPAPFEPAAALVAAMHDTADASSSTTVRNDLTRPSLSFATLATLVTLSPMALGPMAVLSSRMLLGIAAAAAGATVAFLWKFWKERQLALPAAAPLDESHCSAPSPLAVTLAEPPVNSSLVQAAPTPRPTFETLAPEVLAPNWRPAVEWEDLSPAELRCAAAVRRWLGYEGFRRLLGSYDILVLFVRGYAYREDWHAACFVFLERALLWRQSERCDALIAPGGSEDSPQISFEAFAGGRLTEFNAMHPAGIIGQDESGRLVTLDLLCATPSATSLAAFTDEEYLRHMVARREACRALCAASAERLGRRLYKVIAVIDVAGMSLAHLADHKWHARMKRANDLFAWNYPDSIVQLVVINAPRTFSALWAVASLFLHTLTAAKISVHGASYGKALKDMGLNVPLTPDGKLLHNSITPWVDALEQLKQQRGGSDGSGCGGSLVSGFMSETDRRALERIAQEDERVLEEQQEGALEGLFSR
ncbi:sec14-like protein 5 [Chrysochromulina tobinii]|uniref:Sec14-like protein 5 n=1 Tax=Chrysochromulina tobinii TaxID=1460289 RepID=A0A0M0JB86_9EUKA|nr:sec14-like protein 5 [Chrysochromulina tobinii]|eukprot:KOO23458.1 sec14-like protein 5 [Chrysochromulina sp. CCMP291]